MKIAIISPGPFTVPPVKGSSVEHDIDQVSRILAREHEVLVYSRTSGVYPASTQEGNLHFIRLPYEGQSSYIQLVVEDLEKQAADVILVENRPRFVPVIKSRITQVPVIVNMHSHVYASEGVIAPSVMKESVKLMDGMITNSHYLRSFFIRKHNVPEEKITAVHLGVDIEPYQRMRNYELGISKRAKLGYTSKHKVLLFAGRLIKEKGVHLLIQSFQQIVKKDRHARLLIVGGTGYGSNRKNAYVNYLRKLAEPLKGKVKFVNFVPVSEMPIWYHVGDAVATPSIWNEPFCRVNLEGMAAGKPIFTSTRGGTGEVVVDGKTGYSIPPGSWKKSFPKKWAELWSDNDLRAAMSTEAYKRARQFSWEATAAGYLDVFGQAISKNGQN